MCTLLAACGTGNAGDGNALPLGVPAGGRRNAKTQAASPIAGSDSLPASNDSGGRARGLLGNI